MLGNEKETPPQDGVSCNHNQVLEPEVINRQYRFFNLNLAITKQMWIWNLRLAFLRVAVSPLDGLYFE